MHALPTGVQVQTPEPDGFPVTAYVVPKQVLWTIK